MAKECLSQKGVAYTEKDVSRDPKAAAELQQLGQRGVPVIMVDGQMIVGFDRARLEPLLAQSTAPTGAGRPRLGASIADAGSHAPAGGPPGAYIGRVHPESSAARTGLQPGDIIIAMAGQPVHSAAAVEQIIKRLPPRHPVPIRVHRRGRTDELMLEI